MKRISRTREGLRSIKLKNGGSKRVIVRAHNNKINRKPRKK
jgi:hypothetical protein